MKTTGLTVDCNSPLVNKVSFIFFRRRLMMYEMFYRKCICQGKVLFVSFKTSIKTTQN